MKTPRTFVRTLLLLSLLPASANLGACSSEEDAGDGDGGTPGPTFCAPADTCPPDVTGVDLTTPVSFRADVYEPFLRQSCGEISGCHGTAPGSAFLHFGKQAEGLGLDDAAISALVNQLTTQMSVLATTERNVVPGNWQASFLMTKLDGCQNSYGLACDPENTHLALAFCDEPCGDGMPANEELFPTGSSRPMVDKVRAWIAQGALDN